MTPTSVPWLTNEESDLVRWYWERAGAVEPYPRSLTLSMYLAIPVTLVPMPQLTLRAAEQWLRARRRDFSFECASRAVCGCLAAQAGQGIVFIDAGDAEDEIRFTIAHEIGHFLADVHRPRQAAIERFGPTICEVIDGRRPPTLRERLGSVLSGLPLSRHGDYLERSGSGLDAFRTWQLEDRADRIGLALLAPPDDALAAIEGIPRARQFDTLAEALRVEFGVPPLPAQRYAERLLGTSLAVRTAPLHHSL